MNRFVHFTDAANLESILSQGLRLNMCSWDRPRVFLDVLVENEKAHYNAWLRVIVMSPRDELPPPKITAAVVVELEAHEVIYVGQWGWPMPKDDGPRLHLESTCKEEWDDYNSGRIEGVHMAKTTVGHFKSVVTKAVKRVRGVLPGYTGGVYEFLLGKWSDQYIHNRDRKEANRSRFCEATAPYDYYWLGSGFEVNVLHDIPPRCILGHRIFKAKTGIHDAWYCAADFVLPATQESSGVSVMLTPTDPHTHALPHSLCAPAPQR